MGKKKDTRKRTLYNLIVDHWLITLFISQGPFIMSYLVSVFGHNLGLVNDTGKLNLIPFIVILIFSIFCVIIIGLKLYYEKEDNRKRDNAVDVYKSIIDEGEKTTKSKSRNYLEVIQNNNYKGIVASPLLPYENSASRLNPIKAINCLLDSIINLLSRIFGIPCNDIGISIIYKSEGGKWSYLADINVVENDLPLSEIIDLPNTSFSCVKNKSAALIFYPDKNTAIQEMRYAPNAKEVDMGATGSIYCKNISLVHNDKTKIEAILTIATYTQPLCLSDDYWAIDKIRQLFEKIEVDIKYELARKCLYTHLGFSRS